MPARDIDTPARNSSRNGPFSAGRTMATSLPADQSAGGGKLKEKFPTQGGGGALNEGRSRMPGSEVHHNNGTKNIKQGSTEPPR